VRSVEIMLDGVATPNESERLVPEPETAQPKSDDARAAPESLPGPQPAARPAQAAPAQQPAWAVQLGAFSTRGKADRLVTELRSRGYAAFVLEYRADGKLLHRVRVGPEQNRERAAAIAARLRKDGFQPVVAPHP
jgi:DedD protein